MTEFVRAMWSADGLLTKGKVSTEANFTSAAECHSSILRDLPDFNTVQMGQ